MTQWKDRIIGENVITDIGCSAHPQRIATITRNCITGYNRRATPNIDPHTGIVGYRIIRDNIRATIVVDASARIVGDIIIGYV
jgi:hypothetical protein